METGLEEQHGGVRPDLNCHVEEGRTLSLERGRNGDPIESGVIERPPHDLLRALGLEPDVQIPDEILGQQRLH